MKTTWGKFFDPNDPGGAGSGAGAGSGDPAGGAGAAGESTGAGSGAGAGSGDPAGGAGAAGESGKGSEAGKAGAAGKPATTATGAPERYEAFRLPEGVVIDEPTLRAAADTFKAAGLTQEQAQAMVTLRAEAMKAEIETFAREVASWPAAIAKDKELGGTDSAAKVETAQRAITRFGTPELQKMLDGYGLGNHPEFVRFCYRVGSAIREDGLAGGAGTGAAGDRSIADRMWPGQAS